MKTAYITPILVNVLRIYAGVSVLLGILGAFFSLPEGEVTAVLCIAGSIGQAVICLGIGECVDFLGRTAHNTTILAEQAEREQHRQLQAARAVGGGGYGRQQSD
jgi:hypothetical protein